MTSVGGGGRWCSRRPNRRRDGIGAPAARVRGVGRHPVEHPDLLGPLRAGMSFVGARRLTVVVGTVTPVLGEQAGPLAGDTSPPPAVAGKSRRSLRGGLSIHRPALGRARSGLARRRARSGLARRRRVPVWRAGGRVPVWRAGGRVRSGAPAGAWIVGRHPRRGAGGGTIRCQPRHDEDGELRRAVLPGCLVLVSPVSGWTLVTGAAPIGHRPGADGAPPCAIPPDCLVSGRAARCCGASSPVQPVRSSDQAFRPLGDQRLVVDRLQGVPRCDAERPASGTRRCGHDLSAGAHSGNRQVAEDAPKLRPWAPNECTD